MGWFIKERKERNPEVEVAVATKFTALPWRRGHQSVLTALKDSLCRLGLSSVELYQHHWLGICGNKGNHFSRYIDGLGDSVEQGLVKVLHVILDNMILTPEKRLRDAYEQRKKKGIPLASNQVNYSLIHRAPEENGIKEACDELGSTRIAYSPIAQGKYTQENPPTGPRGRIYTPEFLTKLQPLINRIKETGKTTEKHQLRFFDKIECNSFVLLLFFPLTISSYYDRYLFINHYPLHAFCVSRATRKKFV